MRNRITQPRPLELPPVQSDPIRVYGQLRGPMGQPLAGLRILLRAITTTASIMQDTWSECLTDSSGNYDFTVMPGKYAVFFERRGIKERVNNIYIYSDSAPGTLQSFMLAPSADMLTPLMVLEVKDAYEEASAAMLRARQWAENPVDVPVLDFEQGAGPEYSAYHWAHKAAEIVNTDTNINWRGEWSSATAYAFRDAVRYQGSSYYCVEANTGIAPPDIATADNAAWSLMSAKGDQGIQGVPGQNGADGKDGVSGQAGPQGPKGPEGPQGDTGPQGPAGPAPDMSNYYTKAEVDVLINAGGGGGSSEYGEVGSLILATKYIDEFHGGGWSPDQIIDGSELTPCVLIDIDEMTGADAWSAYPPPSDKETYPLSGTWRALGGARSSGETSNSYAVGLFVRVT